MKWRVIQIIMYNNITKKIVCSQIIYTFLWQYFCKYMWKVTTPCIIDFVNLRNPKYQNKLFLQLL
jgi:hypothetical protein